MDDEWGADRLDLDAYLTRVGASADNDLAAIHRAQLGAVPFENLDVMLGRGVSVDLPDIARKVVDDGRGGYCYEHALLLGAALELLGHDVERRLARIGDPAVQPRPRSHLVLLVREGGETWLADTGFGGGLLEPVPLRDGAVVQQGAWSFRTDLVAGAWRLSERRRGEWVALYTVPPETTYFVDVVGANHVTSTSPTSHFTHGIRVQRKDSQVLRWLTGRVLHIDSPDEPLLERTVEDGELGQVLDDLGLHLPAADVTALVATLPPARTA
ncbi:arylamine N-acetyltransferase family protein [Cellulomonas edaphi]|uniref:Arylamine N-acetyltransferase n=1 Tax=Cellulomonas edaphi TaxID=3053468 RepID=A0ABT7S3E0_9CELL|nr:arylamine N-acetyltransferase [Cellulomons edaphi]MDM7830049.1 arylamine N-acetyltransferase [Cellulomons edaphi]